MPPATSNQNHDYIDMAYPSRTIAFQAAGMITSIIENLLQHNQIKYTPAFIVYSLFSALIMHVYQMRSSVASVVSASQERINVCMNALKEVSKVWLVAKMVHTLFESILGNKLMEERLQKATGRKAPRQQKNREQANQTNGNNSIQTEPTAAPAHPPSATNLKRKFDDIDLAFSVGPPAPQVSYERSRPQTPALTPSRELNQQQTNQNNTMLGSPPLHTADHFLSTGKSRVGSRLNSRMGTRANSPFNGFAPATPPDLFLVTRNSPPISQQLWENFQPDQLFPDGSIDPAAINFSSPVMNHAVDPRLQNPSLDPAITQPGGQQSPPVVTQIGINHQNVNGSWPPGLSGMMGANMDMSGNEVDMDRWSNSSTGAPIVPTTLNVEDWFQFFGIHGDVSQFGIEA